MAQKVDVLIIGGGIVGGTLACEIQAGGRQVLLIEKGTPGHGCSYANAGWITPCFAMPLPQPGMFLKSLGWLFDKESPLHIQPQVSFVLAKWMYHFFKAMNHRQMTVAIQALTDISKYSLDFYKSFSTGDRNFGFENRGLLLVSATTEGLKYANLEKRVMEERGIPGKELSREELLDMEPGLRPVVRGGIYFPQEAQAEPLATTMAVFDELSRLGGMIQPHTEVFDFKVAGGAIRSVLTTQGEIQADLVILAAGSWSHELSQRLGLNVPLLGGKGYSMNFDFEERKPTRPIMIVEKKIAVTPREGSRVRVAGTLELVNQDHSISPVRLNAIQKGAREYLYLSDSAEPQEIWRGLRPCTPDGVPMIGYSGKIKNLFYSMGHQLLGLQSAPGSARLAADLIFDRSPLTDPRPFRPQRFE